MNKHTISLFINGKNVTAEVESRTLLVYFLRDQMKLTGAHIACDTSSCGACNVLIDGKSIKSCTLLAVQADGAKITTVEGLSKNGEFDPVQQAFKDQHGLQCGFCTPGMIITTKDLLSKNPKPSEAEIREALEGNICRCTGYHNIVRAVQQAAGQLETV